MKSLIFPDVNVWLALNYEKHVHNASAVRWYKTLDPAVVFVFCRHTQLGLFRLLSSQAVLKEDTLDQNQCWSVFDRWIDSDAVLLAQEPPNLDSALRARTSASLAAPKMWADDYLAAFAEVANLTLVTFDRALAGKTKRAVLLG
jgi:toxin-antitoxin system PIN domain toxin